MVTTPTSFEACCSCAITNDEKTTAIAVTRGLTSKFETDFTLYFQVIHSDSLSLGVNANLANADGVNLGIELRKWKAGRETAVAVPSQTQCALM